MLSQKRPRNYISQDELLEDTAGASSGGASNIPGSTSSLDPVDDTTIERDTSGRLTLKDGGISTDKLADASVTDAKLADDAKGVIVKSGSGLVGKATTINFAATAPIVTTFTTLSGGATTITFESNGTIVTGNPSINNIPRVASGNTVIDSCLSDSGSQLVSTRPFYITQANSTYVVRYVQTSTGNAQELETSGNGGEALSARLTHSTSTHAAVKGECTGAGDGVYGLNSSTGVAGRFYNSSTSNASEVVRMTTNGSGGCLYLRYDGSATASATAAYFIIGKNAGTQVFRVDKNGKGYFNGGTQSSGADVAEAVTPAAGVYAPGDVVMIDTSADDQFKLCDVAASPLVAGVISTQPGVTLADEGIDADLTGKIALALVGRVPTKVSDAGGAIGIGDLLVSSALPGHAQKAGPTPEPGTIIGKALGALASGTGVITVLVNLQ